MTPGIATVVFAAGVLGLFVLNRDRNARTSKALWIPVVWTSIVGSRMVSQWLEPEVAIVSPEQLLDGSPLDRNSLAALIAAGVIVLLGRRREVGILLLANGPIVAFFSYCAVSILWSDFPDVAFKRWTRAVGDLVMIMIILTDPDRPAAIKRFLARIGFLLIPASILLIRYYPHLGQYWLEGRTFFTGVTLDKNMLGMICLVSGLGCVWRLDEAFHGQEGTRKAGPLIAQGALLTMVLLILFRIDSMTSLACFVLAAGLMVATSFPVLARQRAVVHLPVASVLCLAFAALMLDVGGELVGAMGRESTLTGRTDLWKHLLSMNQHQLLGTGFESFWLGNRLKELWGTYPGLNEAHNGYLEVFLNLGWVGVTLLALTIAAGYRNIARTFHRDPATGRLKLAYFVAGTVYGMTEAAFRVGNPVWILFLLVITTVPNTEASEARNATLSRFHRVVPDCVADPLGRKSLT